jgi:hypothetical protein
MEELALPWYGRREKKNEQWSSTTWGRRKKFWIVKYTLLKESYEKWQKSYI